MTSFDSFFQRATTHPPYGYQARLARDGLPAVVQAPTGSGKTGIILAWLWRRLHGPDPAATPRRLIFALPQRSLVEQVGRTVRTWLDNLDLADDAVALHMVMGGLGDTQWLLRQDMHRAAIVVGTVDALVSKALHRGHGLSPAGYPIDFALVTNGAHWVIDEMRLVPAATTTLRQLAGFTTGGGGGWHTAEPFGLTCMSATAADELLHTADNPPPANGDVVRVENGDRTGELAVRLAAARTVHRLPVRPGDHRALAAAIRERHRPGTRTLVVLNTVAAARGVYAALRVGPTPCTLLHTRFRGIDRQPLIDRMLAEPGPDGHIVVATQVVEAGVDLDAAVLVTEAAPWPSLLRRAGRCNRRGRLPDAELWWLPPAEPAPYPPDDVRSSVSVLETLAGRSLTGEELAGLDVATTPPEVPVIRRADLLTLFDTMPAVTGADLDVGPYVHDADESDVQLAWARWTSIEDTGTPPPEARTPDARWRCRVSLGELRELTRRVDVWRYQPALGEWERVTDEGPLRPGEALVVAAEAGGYDIETGFDASSGQPVLDCPPIPAYLDLVTSSEIGTDVEVGTGGGHPHEDDGDVPRDGWLSLEQHSVDVRDHARALMTAIRPALPVEVLRAVEVAAYAHDAGKYYPLWQDALCRLAAERDQLRIQSGRPWAKSGLNMPLDAPHAVGFRHELVSMLLLSGPLRGLLTGIDDQDLVRYLVLAHHGKLRVQVRGPDDTDDKRLLGLTHNEVLPIAELLGQPAGELTVDLDQFGVGGERSWTGTVCGLRDRYGPFVLAYLETLVRVADWRASAGDEEAA